jgi:hypothetical protein
MMIKMAAFGRVEFYYRTGLKKRVRAEKEMLQGQLEIQ